MLTLLKSSQQEINSSLGGNIGDCSKKSILLFVSLAYNIASGRVPLSPSDISKLKPHKNFILKLGCCQSTICEKRALLRAYKSEAKEAISLMNDIILSK